LASKPLVSILKLPRITNKAGDRIAEAAWRAVLDLGLFLIGRGPVNVAVEIEDAVFRLVVAITRRDVAVHDMRVVDRLLVRHVLAGLVLRVQDRSAELELVALGRTQCQLAETGAGREIRYSARRCRFPSL